MLPDDFNWPRSNALSSNLHWKVDSPESSCHPLEALSELCHRVVAELEKYRLHAIDIGDSMGQTAADQLMEWLDSQGASVVDQIAARIRAADSHDQALMERAITAAESLADTALDDWDLMFDWAKEILLALRRSFRQFDVIDELDMAVPVETVSAVLSEETQDMWSVSRGNPQVKRYPFAA